MKTVFERDYLPNAVTTCIRQVQYIIAASLNTCLYGSS